MPALLLALLERRATSEAGRFPGLHQDIPRHESGHHPVGHPLPHLRMLELPGNE